MTFKIETDRLVIVEPSLTQLPDWTTLLSDPEVMRYIGSGPRSPDECRQSLDNAISHLNEHGFSVGSVYDKKGGTFIGRAGLIHLEYNSENAEIEIGYSLHKSFWGKGFATELTRGIIHFGFTQTSITKLIGITHQENIASQKVLQKAGMHYVGASYAYHQVVEKFEILKSNWKMSEL